MINHRVYQMLDRIEALRLFMEYHCYAVYDFMSLAKSLQRQLTCLQIPWIPVENTEAARMINEIIVVEESDLTPEGNYASHCELYLQGMREIGADTSQLQLLLYLLREGVSYQLALEKAKVPLASAEFVRTTLSICENQPMYAIAASFFFGRENLIPEMIYQIVEKLSTSQRLGVKTFRFYLERHIDVDKNQHGPAGQRMLASLCGANPSSWKIVEKTAKEALQVRLNLWDSIANAINEI